MSGRLFYALSILLVFSQLFAQQKYEINQYKGLPQNLKINDIVLGDGISSYVATDEGLYYVPSVGVESRSIIPGKYIQSLSDFKNNSFYIGGDNLFSNSLKPSTNYYIGDKTVKISALEKIKDELWLGSNDGIYVVNLKTNKVTRHFTPNNSVLVSKQINFIHYDDHGVTWIGTRNGILRVLGENWKNYEKNHSFEGIFENSEGLWVLTDKELWNIDNINQANRWYKLNLKKDLKKGVVNDLVIDSRGRLIIASDILVRFDPYSNNIEKFGSDLGLIAQKCNALAIDKEDRVWIGTNDSGLYTVGFKDHLQQTKQRIPLNIVLISQQPTCFEENDGSIKLMIKGGTKNVSINWSTGESDVRNLENLLAGDYSVTVTEPKKDTIIKFITLNQPTKLSIIVNKINKNPTDNRSSVSFDITGGTPGFRLEIDGIVTENPATDVFPGQHLAKVTDVFGCYAETDFTVEGESTFADFEAKDIKVGQVLQIENLYFLADSVEITNSSKPVLDEVFNFLTENQDIFVEIGGHTNNIPPDDYCDRLSSMRAKNIAEYLINRGMDRNRVSFKGYGKRFPIASNDTVDGRRKNQRVELKILGIGKN
ncbi:MAG: OmpA family protein [Saprospiraceae bacterium]|nr:OmpA family protein [Saprospiraceae bacterium]